MDSLSSAQDRFFGDFLADYDDFLFDTPVGDIEDITNIAVVSHNRSLLQNIDEPSDDNIVSNESSPLKRRKTALDDDDSEKVTTEAEGTKQKQHTHLQRPQERQSRAAYHRSRSALVIPHEPPIAKKMKVQADVVPQAESSIKEGESNRSHCLHTDQDIISFAIDLHKAFNCGNMDIVNSLIDQFCVPGFVFRTSFSDNDRIGRDNYKNLFSALLQDHPDRLHTMKYSKLVRDKQSQGRYLAVKVSYEGTKCTFARNELDLLLEQHRPDVLQAIGADESIALRMQRFERTRTPYTYSGVTWMRYALTDDNMLSEVMLTRKLTSCEVMPDPED
jgi:hypothetical protein